MKVLKTMVERGWLQVGSDAYRDEDEDTFRDIDASGFVQRWCSLNDRTVAIVFVFLAIEVKKSASPWVVFKPPVTSSLARREWGESLIYSANMPCSLFRLTEQISEGSIVSRQGWFGRGIHEAFKSPSERSRWYSAFVTSCKAAEAIMHREASAEAPRGSVSTATRNETAYFLIARPVVVLDGILVAAELDDAGELLLSPTDSAEFEFRFSSKHCKENHYFVDVVTLQGFAAYLDSWVERRNRIAAAIHRSAGIDSVIYED